MKTKLIQVLGIIIMLLFTNNKLYSQITTLNTFGGAPGDFAGWSQGSSLNFDIVNEDAFPIKFYTSGGPGSGGIWNNLRMIIAGNGNVGVGNNTTPLSLFHLHQSAASTSTLFHLTNVGTGTALTEGFDILQQNAGPVFFNQNELDFIRFQSISNAGVLGGATLRRRLDISTYNFPSISGLHDRTRVWIAGDFPFAGQALSLLTIGGNYPALTHGHRNWMDYGTLVIGGSDNVYFGIKNEDPDIALYNDHNDAVISWGDNTLVPDNLNDIRFIFTTEMGTTSGISSQQDGQEMARISWNGNFGIGNFYNHPGVGAGRSI
ncbi:MAG: hypothetical protein IPK10_05325 [Bacteroidetes bacterium]|nr:hypothetical protein [Bacteroidota bacterium]